MKEIEAWVRPNIKALKPYASARDEFKGEASVYLDANENSFGSPLPQNYNRYPDPLQMELKEKISRVKGLPPQNIFLGNGSDEAIDLLFRVFCEPAQDKVLICPPTYGMYEVSAHIHNVDIVRVNLLPGFELDVEQILESLTPSVKLLFICSPNNPTANSFHADDVELLVQKFNGIVVIDEAYINYSRQKSAIRWLTEYDNLVVLQTFSKAWGLAALRLGMAFASETIIHYLNKVKPPYNINIATQQYALEALDNIQWVNEHIRQTVALREALITELKTLPLTQKVFPSDANFILLRVTDAPGLYKHLVENGIIVRDRSKVQLCEGCLRITVGTPEENENIIRVIKMYKA
ncbi:MAG: histidinol-phosphate transaminase [Bacteroidetes bacterium]|nr:histidinol-phosphate transaminase [Bacteroidota bacterium]